MVELNADPSHGRSDATRKDVSLSHPATFAHALAQHRQQTERALAALRADETLDDRAKGQRITEVIAAANTRLVALVGQRATEAVSEGRALREPFNLTDRRDALAGTRNRQWG